LLRKVPIEHHSFRCVTARQAHDVWRKSAQRCG
jgi:hypothetical protein